MLKAGASKGIEEILDVPSETQKDDPIIIQTMVNDDSMGMKLYYKMQVISKLDML